MEVMVPPKDFHFNAAMAASAPSSPKRFGNPFDYLYHYTSAPSSPTLVAAVLSVQSHDDDDFDFAFGLSGRLNLGEQLLDLTTSADVLFEEGRIRPLEQPPPRAEAAAGERGRHLSTPSSRSRKGSRSLSPLRGDGEVGGYFRKSSNSPKASTPVASTATDASEFIKKSGSGGSRKWRLKDLLLFRSASEGHATGSRSKYAGLSPPSSSMSLFPLPPGNKRGGESSRSTESANRSTRRGGAVSAHEKHYTSNRAASEGMKKKTPLPYGSPGFFGLFRLNPAKGL